jgi:hypothetical protein
MIMTRVGIILGMIHILVMITLKQIGLSENRETPNPIVYDVPCKKCNTMGHGIQTIFSYFQLQPPNAQTG